jgi:hypothetical protein
MSKKALYNLIEMNYRAANFVLPKGIRLINKRHTSGGLYFLFELPMEREMRIDNLDLISHHVSVYEAPTGKIDLKSQYHYTAFFEANDGTQYRLHVFYDAYDGFLTSPMLSVLKGDEYVSVTSEDLDNEFADLATTSCSELITFLRATQKNRVDDLQRQCQVLEERLNQLSSDLVKNKKEYLEVITIQIHLLDELSRISNKSIESTAQMRWLIASREIIEAEAISKKPAQDNVSSEKGKIHENEHKEVGVRKAVKKPHLSKTKPVQIEPPPAQPKPSITSDVRDLKLKLNSCEMMDDPEFTVILMELYGRLKEIEWQVEFKERTAKIEDLIELRVVNARIEKKGIETLQRLLIRADFKNAEKLYSFYHLLPDNMFFGALQMGRPALLDFLLKNNIASVHMKNFTVREVVYSSLVDYFFKTAGSDESRITCLGVLIKHGASLMGIDNKSGLPYAALLLSQLNHPLRALLERNPELTLNNIDFYKKMNQVLRGLNPSSVTINLNDLISRNKESIVLLRQKIAPFKPYDKKLDKSLGQELSHQIQTDPQISYQSGQISRAVALLLPRISQANRKQFMLLMGINYDLLAMKLNKIDNPELIPPFEDLKRETIKLQLIILEFIALLKESIDQDDAANHVNPFSRKELKAMRGLAVRRKLIYTRVSEIQSILIDSYTDLLRDHARNSLAKKTLSAENLLTGSFEDSDEEDKPGVTAGSSIRKGISSTFFGRERRVSSVSSVPPEVEDIEDSSEKSNDTLSDNQGGAKQSDISRTEPRHCKMQ